MLKKQSGFTLIETTIVLAMSVSFGLFFVSFFAGLRSQAEFSDSLDSLKNEVLARRQEALSTIKIGGGVDPANISVGRLLTFTPGSSTVQVYSLYTANSSGAPSSSQRVFAIRPSSDTSDITIPWAASYLSTCIRPASLAFIRSPIDGSLMTSASSSAWSEPYTYGLLTSSSALTANFKIPITGSGKKGYLTIDANTSGILVEHVEDAGVLACP